MHILVTGSAGFIGSNFVRLLMDRTNHHLISFDALTYAGHLENIQDTLGSRHVFVKGTISSRHDVDAVFQDHRIDAVIHFAAESHVDRSITDASLFVQTNVVGTQILLDVSRQYAVDRFIHVSTDEVYGSLGVDDAAFTEHHPILPNSPYSASKAASDLLVRSYVETHNFPAIITRCSNNYGPFQFPEKLIPRMIYHAKHGKPLPVYGDGQNVRDWIHVHDHCTAILALFEHGVLGEVYNIGAECELSNLQVVHSILDACSASYDLIEFIHDRPGHDRRYAMNNQKIYAACDWRPIWTFARGLASTIEWYDTHTDWLARVIPGEYELDDKEA